MLHPHAVVGTRVGPRDLPAIVLGGGHGVDLVTIPDYPLVMTTVGTAALKAHLSEHLQSVRRGETIIVLDRKEAIAHIVPVGAAGLSLSSRAPSGPLHEVPLLPPIVSRGDVMEQLGEERRERLE